MIHVSRHFKRVIGRYLRVVLGWDTLKFTFFGYQIRQDVQLLLGKKTRVPKVQYGMAHPAEF